VRLDTGIEVRLAGIIAPRADDVGSESPWAPERAAHRWLDREAGGQSVRLWFEEGARKDRYGRWIAHLDLRRPDTDTSPPLDSVQVRLLRAGHARVEATREQRGCLSTLLAAEDAARTAGRGLWTEAAYRVRGAAPVRDLAGFTGTFQIITGRVRAVTPARDRWRLTVGDSAPRGLTVSIANTEREVLGWLGGTPESVRDQWVEVRGWLTRGRPDGRLEIDLSMVGSIRRIDGHR
jgi:endonuclease YncB( thermonuclease family)